MRLIPPPLFLLCAILIVGCGKVEYCDFEGSATVKVGDTTLFQGCASDRYDHFRFTIDGGPLGEQAAFVGFTTDPQNYEMLDNGDRPVASTVSGCSDFVEIRFDVAGTYTLMFEAERSRKRFNCNSNPWEGLPGRWKFIDIIVEE